ncbi:MAG: HAD-IIIC family phosphatase, partial [Alphaproteobacteria bacterium]|nr:HAD-IIIC family phosphatase [Alphaproteobacteria bacterium]
MNPREELKAAFKTGKEQEIKPAVATYLKIKGGTAATEFCASRLQEYYEQDDTDYLNVAFMSSYTSDTLAPYLVVSEFLSDRPIRFQSFPYHQWHADLTSGVNIDTFKPDVIFLSLLLEDIAPLLARQHLAERKNLTEETDTVFAALHSAISAYRSRHDTPIVLSSFIPSSRGVERHFDWKVSPSRQQIVNDMNSRLAELSTLYNNIYVFDYAATVTDFGRSNWYDISKGYHVQTPISSRALPYLSQELTSFLSALLEPRKKVLAVDADNTLWGGILGEDDIDGVQHTGPYPGNAYADFRATLANLKSSGIALALASKNNMEDMQLAFDAGLTLPLSKSDFAAVEINWTDKSSNLKKIAADLNVGLDAVCFADDSAFECDSVRSQIPSVHVYHLNARPGTFAGLILEEGDFYSANLTSDDFLRSDSYRAELSRTDASTTAISEIDFLKSLKLALTIRVAASRDVARIAQLFGKTNQFNLTTKRYNPADISNFIDREDCQLLMASLVDRYGDYGTIGVAL